MKFRPEKLKKMQSADWFTKEAGDESPSSLCISVFTPVLRDQQAAIREAVHNVEMDCRLNNPAHGRSGIGKTLCSSYKITTINEAIKTLASLLVTLINLAGWKPGRLPR